MKKLHICEDLYLVCCCIATANNIVYSPKPFYHYMIRPDSATNLYSEKVITKLEAYSNIIQLLEQVSCDKNVDLAKMRYTQFAIDIRRMALEANDKVMIKHIKKQEYKYMKDVLRSNFIIGKEKLRIWYMHFFPRSSIKIWSFLKKRLKISCLIWE